ncbi:MAG: CoA transferase [Caldilineaceae bacterium]|nr:CoA transferase [Caldilineaceae bacterium]
MSGALDGITVIDLSRVLAGPYATMLLGDLGARVIKIEQPGRGDDTRRWGPPFTPNGESAYFLCANRNKESVTLDLKHPTGSAIVREMIARADIVVENFKVGGMAALGLSYEALQRINPALIYCSITGYGQTGPYRDRAGYDAVIEAEGGIMSITGPSAGENDEGHPYKVGVAVVDVTAGMNAVIAILAALHHRQQTGMGQAIDIALLDTQVSWLANVASAYLVSGQTPKRYGNAHASIVPYQAVRAADGWLMLAVGNDAQFQKLCHLLELPALAEDERFVTNQARVVHRTELLPLLEAAFAHAPVAAWTERLGAAGIPAGPVNDIPTVLADPQIQARGMVQTVEHPITGPIPLVGPVPKFSSTPATIHRPPPLLGEHTNSVLSEWLGYTNEQIRELAVTGVI